MRRAAALFLVATLAATCGASKPSGESPAWASPGLIGTGGWPFARQPIPADEARGGHYLPDSSVLALPGGRARIIPFGKRTAESVPLDDPAVTDAVRADKSWLASGRIPGQARHRDMAVRALLDLRMLTYPNGGTSASWYGAWNYVWPRDAAFAAAAFSATGHSAEAQRVLYFLARAQDRRGLWAARYHPDGTAVIDKRPRQLDGLGWVLWASWMLHEKDPEAADGMRTLWPMVRRAADRAAVSLGADGLPPPSPDYWERSPATEQAPGQPTLGVCAPLLAGLRSATALADKLGHASDAHRWQRAAARLENAVDRDFAPLGYPRSPVKGGALDTSVTFLAPPFGPRVPGVRTAVDTASTRLALPNGGVLPGERWAGNKKQAWTPETAMFALAFAASGDTARATGWLDWLSTRRTSLGALPEKVNPAGKPAAVAPLGWTCATVLLGLAAMDGAVPAVS